MKRSYSQCSNSSKDFSVSTGGPIFVSPSTPLGSTVAHDHYIQPVPPNYVTEYEASYVWPPKQFYNHSSPTIVVSPEKPSQQASKDNKEKEKQLSWKKLEEIINKMVEKGFERHLFDSLKSNIKKHPLDAAIECAYEHLRDITQGDCAMNSKVKGDKEVNDLCNKFIRTIEEIKSL